MKFSLLVSLSSMFVCSPTPQVYLIPGGDNIVFELNTDGVIVTGSYDIKNENSTYNPTRDSNIIKGDIIKEIEGHKVDSLASFVSHFNKYINKGKIEVTLYRDKVKLVRYLHLIKIDDDIKTGLYVKERVLGIGTMSFYDPNKKIYGALGHEVFDPDSKQSVELKSGSIYESSVIGIKKNASTVGEKVGSTELSNKIGDIISNTECGIFGHINNIPTSYTPLKMAEQKEVKLGKALIKTVTKGSKVEEYEINITELKSQDNIDIKGISFTITDKKLLDIGGGIYYGMSGSPIIQDNLLIGAVTHVLSSDVTSGYGIYMESMYNKAIQSL